MDTRGKEAYPMRSSLLGVSMPEDDNIFLIGQPVPLTSFPTMACDPPIACLGNSTCAHEYDGLYCVQCRFKFYKSSKSDGKCGLIMSLMQVIGTMILISMSCFGSVGSLFGLCLILKLKTDRKFRTTMVLIVRVRVLKPFKRWWKSGKGQAVKWPERKVETKISNYHLSMSRNYSTNRIPGDRYYAIYEGLSKLNTDSIGSRGQNKKRAPSEVSIEPTATLAELGALIGMSPFSTNCAVVNEFLEVFCCFYGIVGCKLVS